MVDAADGKIIRIQDPSGEYLPYRDPEAKLPKLDLSKLRTSATKVRCAVSLQLLMDESSSISNANWQMQLKAYAAAFRDPEIIQKIKEAPGGIEVMAMSFAKTSRIRIPFGLIQGEKDAFNYADLLEKIGVQVQDGTEIGDAVIRGVGLFNTGYCKYSKPVIDVSSDMEDTEATIAKGRDVAEAAGITVNGLVVEDTPEKIAKGVDVAKRNLKTSDGFVMATSYKDFAEAIKKKLALEIAQATKAYKEAQLNDGDWVAPTTIPANQNGTGQPAKAVQARF